jgi:hypothetical protein
MGFHSAKFAWVLELYGMRNNCDIACAIGQALGRRRVSEKRELELLGLRKWRVLRFKLSLVLQVQLNT